jgi:hypothetical protein
MSDSRVKQNGRYQYQCPTCGHYKPDRYYLIDSHSLKEYVFTPHYGLERKG